jgi:hypothetical protein
MCFSAGTDGTAACRSISLSPVPPAAILTSGDSPMHIQLPASNHHTCFCKHHLCRRVVFKGDCGGEKCAGVCGESCTCKVGHKVTLSPELRRNLILQLRPDLDEDSDEYQRLFSRKRLFFHTNHVAEKDKRLGQPGVCVKCQSTLSTI